MKKIRSDLDIKDIHSGFRLKRWMWRLEKTLNSKILAPSGAFLLPVIQMNRAQRADAHSNIGSDDL